MITGIFSLLFIGSLSLYSTSSKTNLKGVTRKPQLERYFGCLLYLLALIISIIHLGNLSGFLFWLLSLAVILSLTIVIYPLKIVNYKLLVVLGLIALFFEITSTIQTL